MGYFGLLLVTVVNGLFWAVTGYSGEWVFWAVIGYSGEWGILGCYWLQW